MGESTCSNRESKTRTAELFCESFQNTVCVCKDADCSSRVWQVPSQQNKKQPSHNAADNVPALPPTKVSVAAIASRGLSVAICVAASVLVPMELHAAAFPRGLNDDICVAASVACAAGRTGTGRHDDICVAASVVGRHDDIVHGRRQSLGSNQCISQSLCPRAAMAATIRPDAALVDVAAKQCRRCKCFLRSPRGGTKQCPRWRVRRGRWCPPQLASRRRSRRCWCRLVRAGWTHWSKGCTSSHTTSKALSS